MTIRKSKAIAIALMIVAVSSATATVHASELRVMVVFSYSASLATNVNDKFEDIEAYVGQVFASAGVDAPSFVLYPSNHNFFDQGLSSSAATKLGYRPDLRKFRNENAADLVLFVLTGVNSSNQGTCGAAQPTPSVLSSHSPSYPLDLAFGLGNQNIHKGFSDVKFGAYVTLLQSGGCALSSPEETAAHEIGHLLFGDHQVEFDAQGDPTKDANSSDTSWDKPVQYNHAAD